MESQKLGGRGDLLDNEKTVTSESVFQRAQKITSANETNGLSGEFQKINTNWGQEFGDYNFGLREISNKPELKAELQDTNNSEISALLEAMILCHNCRAVGDRFESDIPEETSMLNFCKGLGFEPIPKSVNQHAKNKFVRVIITMDKYGNRSTYSIIGMNIEFSLTPTSQSHLAKETISKITVLVKKTSGSYSGESTLYTRTTPEFLKEKFS